MTLCPAHTFVDESRWCAPKGAVSARFPRDISGFPSKILNAYINGWRIFTLVGAALP